MKNFTITSTINVSAESKEEADNNLATGKYDADLGIFAEVSEDEEE
jgi:hypothetical protein